MSDNNETKDDNYEKNEDNKTEIFESYPVPKAVTKLALPTVIGMMVMVLYNLIDTYFIGLTNDPVQVAAVSLAMPIFLILMGCGNLFGIGAGANISRYLGQKDYKKVSTISSFAMWSAVVLGTIVGLVSFYHIDAIVYGIGADTESFEYVRGYLLWIGYGSVFIILSVVLSALLRSEGYVKQSTIGILIGTFTNVILDPIFIFTLGFEVVGAAMATVIANVLVVCFYIITILRLKEANISIKIADYKIDKALTRDLYAIGVPASLNNMLMSFASIVYNIYLAKYGTITVAAMGIVVKLNMISVIFFSGLGSGIQPLLGYAYGAKLTERLRETVVFSLKVSVISGFVFFAMFYGFAPEFIGGFIDEAQVIEQGADMLRKQIVTAPILGFVFITINLMQVSNRAKTALLLSVSRQGITFIPAVMILDAVAGLDGLVWAQPIADLVSIAVAIIICVTFFKNLNEEKDEIYSQGEIIDINEFFDSLENEEI